MAEQVAPGAASSDEHEATVVTEPSGKGVGDVSTTAGSTEGGAGTPSSSTDGDSKNASENSGEQSGAGQKGAAAEEWQPRLVRGEIGPTQNESLRELPLVTFPRSWGPPAAALES